MSRDFVIRSGCGAPTYRADINVFDFNRRIGGMPVMDNDLPGVPAVMHPKTKAFVPPRRRGSAHGKG